MAGLRHHELRCLLLLWRSRSLRGHQVLHESGVFLPSIFLGYIPIYLGFLDLLRNFGFFFGSLYALVFPLREPKKALVLLTLIKCMLLVMLTFQKWAGEYSRIYCSAIMLGIGFLKLQHSSIVYLMSSCPLTQAGSWIPRQNSSS